MVFLCPLPSVLLLLRLALSNSAEDPRCLSRIPDPNFSIPDPGFRVKRQRIPDPDLQQRILLFLTKNWYLALVNTKYYPECLSRIRIFSYPGSSGQKNTGPRIRNAATKLQLPIAVINDSKTTGTFKIVFVFWGSGCRCTRIWLARTWLWPPSPPPGIQKLPVDAPLSIDWLIGTEGFAKRLGLFLGK